MNGAFGFSNLMGRFINKICESDTWGTHYKKNVSEIVSGPVRSLVADCITQCSFFDVIYWHLCLKHDSHAKEI